MAETQEKQLGMLSFSRTRSARHDYEICVTFVCGLVLSGTEV